MQVSARRPERGVGVSTFDCIVGRSSCSAFGLLAELSLLMDYDYSPAAPISSNRSRSGVAEWFLVSFSPFSGSALPARASSRRGMPAARLLKGAA